MITVKLRGGLGNQLFQYALGRNIAEKNNTRLALDLSVYYNSVQRSDYTLRGFELGVFNIQADLIYPPTIPFVRGIVGKRLSNIIQKTKTRLTKKVISEKAFHFEPQILLSPDNSYLSGYWHSEKYFKEIEGKLRSELTLKAPLNNRIAALVKEIQNTNSVSVHIRRGDYLTNTWAQQTFNFLDLSYYKTAIEVIQKQKGELCCFIFSDDPDWVNENISLPNKTIYVIGNKNFEDLYLMSQCKHNIIANSSFSWWGAWLNLNEEKKVVAPQLWFKDPKINTSDLIPLSWTSL